MIVCLLYFTSSAIDMVVSYFKVEFSFSHNLLVPSGLK